LIGESIAHLSPHMASLVRCLEPINETWPDGAKETSLEFQQRTVCHTYVHVLRCLSSQLSTWFLTLNCDEFGTLFMGELFVSLVHNFKLHKSYNTFLFCQVSPFKVFQNIEKFRISPTCSLNLGLYGKNEAGEHRQKLVKEHRLKWTDKRPGCFRSLVDQTVEVFMGGTYLFPKTVIPARTTLGLGENSENQTSWHIRFGSIGPATANESYCFACRSKLAGEESEAVLENRMDSSKLCSDIFNLSEMQKHLLSANFKNSPHNTYFLFAKFLNLKFDAHCCNACMHMFFLLYGLHFQMHQKIVW
jgi:hypothetical protein